MPYCHFVHATALQQIERQRLLVKEVKQQAPAGVLQPTTSTLLKNKQFNGQLTQQGPQVVALSRGQQV